MQPIAACESREDFGKAEVVDHSVDELARKVEHLAAEGGVSSGGEGREGRGEVEVALGPLEEADGRGGARAEEAAAEDSLGVVRAEAEDGEGAEGFGGAWVGEGGGDLMDGLGGDEVGELGGGEGGEGAEEETVLEFEDPAAVEQLWGSTTSSKKHGMERFPRRSLKEDGRFFEG